MNLYPNLNTLFEPELLTEFEAKGMQVSVKEGEIVIAIGQLVRQVPIVLSGSLKIVRIDEEGNEILLYYLSQTESCAMTFTCCMQQFPSEVQAVAEEDSEILMLPISFMNEWIIKYPGWRIFVMKTIHYRFQELLKAVDQIAFQQLDERLIQYLKDKVRISGSLLLNLSHEQIATELATSRTVISRLLKKLENQKKLLLYRNQVRILGDM
ncbi:MAG: Crp/Fnr family transcriptional regulator [Sediminibacterium sp.]